MSRVEGTSTTTGLLAAFFASLCCIGPLAFAALGAGVGATGLWAGATGFLKTLSPYRPLFILVAVLCFAVSFYLVYRKPAGACKSGTVCQPVANAQSRRRLLWTLAALALVLITAPYWLGL